MNRNDLYKVYILVGLSVALFVLFGPNFGVIFVVLLIAFWLLIVTCRHLYTLTQCRFYRIVDRLLSVLISAFLVILLMVALFISSEYHSDEGALEEMDYVIILGAGLKGVEPSKTLIGRLDTGLNYLRYHPNVPVILSGGRGPGENTTEAEAMAKYLTNRGIDQDQLILESHSRTTAENFAFSKALMNKKNGKELKVLIITSDYHLFRAKQIAKETGYVIYGKASESPILLRINYTIRECFGVIQTFLIMKINSLQEGLI